MTEHKFLTALAAVALAFGFAIWAGFMLTGCTPRPCVCQHEHADVMRIKAAYGAGARSCRQ